MPSKVKLPCAKYPKTCFFLWTDNFDCHITSLYLQDRTAIIHFPLHGSYPSFVYKNVNEIAISTRTGWVVLICCILLIM